MSEKEQGQPESKYPGTGQYPGSYPGSYPGGQYPSNGFGEGISLNELVNTLWRRKGGIIVTTGIVALAALVYSLTRVPTFEAEARVLLEEGAPSTGILGELSMLTGAPPATAELEVVKSRQIANRVIANPADDSLGLGLTIKVDDLDRYAPLALLKRKFTGEEPQGSLAAALVQPVTRRDFDAALVTFTSADRGDIRWDKFSDKESLGFVLADGPISLGGAQILLHAEGNLTGRHFRLRWTTPRGASENLLSHLSAVETARGSGVLRITYKDTDPDRAAASVNSVVSAYMDRSRERLALRAHKTVEYISEQITRIQVELDEAEKELVAFQEKEGTALLSDAARAVVERMSGLDLERARLAMLIESQNRLVKAMEGGAPVEEVGAGAEVDPQTASMLQELVTLVAQASFLADEHTEEWPPLMQLRAQIKQMRKNIAGAATARADSLQRKDESLARALERWQTQLNSLPATERELAKFQRKAQSFESIYTYLLAEEQQARIAENAAVAAVSVVDWAVPPLYRSSPNLTLNLAIAILLGLLLGAAIALWREANEKTILTASQLEAVTGLPQWGVIPDFRRGSSRTKGVRGKEHFLALRDAPDSAVAESYRAIRANLRFAAKGKEIKTLTITSAAQGEGKSTTIADLAIALANGGSSVLLVDADLRRPVIHRMFPCQISPGLAEIIKDSTPWQQALHEETGTSNLHVLPAGAVSGTNPGDLLALKSVIALVDDLKENYDYVLFDVPPVLAVADAASFLNHLDAILLLSRYDHVPEAAVAGANHRLALSGAQTFGTILNGLRTSRMKHDYGYGYGYEKSFKT
ncbi:MAG: polysaccharide biosynthesis tyrosine autokinase [Planctomycetota bacterium]|nr:polysaccharide biosynthesis tyrosine autokinase [Planctomycetota bacterium]